MQALCACIYRNYLKELTYINHRLSCSYGGNRAGIFVAVNFLINQLTLSGYIDVYYVVKMLHLQRTGIFESPV